MRSNKTHTTPARAQHESGGAINAPQNVVSHAAIAVIADAPAVMYLPANPNRVTALCQVADGEVMIGDATTDATHGVMLSTTRFEPSVGRQHRRDLRLQRDRELGVRMQRDRATVNPARQP